MPTLPPDRPEHLSADRPGVPAAHYPEHDRGSGSVLDLGLSGVPPARPPPSVLWSIVLPKARTPPDPPRGRWTGEALDTPGKRIHTGGVGVVEVRAGRV